MFVYILLFLYIFFISNIQRNNLNKKNVYIVAAIFSIMAFKDVSVGVDTKNYIYQYISATHKDMNTFEPLFGNLLYFFNSVLQVPPRIFWILTYIVIVTPMFFLCKKYSPKPELTFILYLTIGAFAFNLSGLRQSLTIALIQIGTFLYLFTDYKKKFTMPIFLSILLVCMNIHNTSKVCFILLLIPLIRKITKIRLLLMLIVPLICVVVSSYVPIILQPFFQEAKYAGYESFYTNYNANFLFVVGVPYLVFLYTIYLYFKGFSKRIILGTEKPLIYLLLLSCLSVSISCLGLNFLIIQRFVYYFNFYNYILIPILLYRYKIIDKENLKIHVFAIMFLSISFFFISIPGDVLKIDNYMFGIN